MSVVVHRTCTILVTDLQSMSRLVLWSEGSMSGSLTGKRVLVVGSIYVNRSRYSRITVSKFLTLVAQSRVLGIDFIFLTNTPARLDERITLCIDRTEEALY